MQSAVTAHLLAHLGCGRRGLSKSTTGPALSSVVRSTPGQRTLATNLAGGSIHGHAFSGCYQRCGGLIDTHFLPRSHLRQSAVQAGENEIMHTSTVAKTHLVLGGVHIHVDLCRIELQVEHESRVAAVVQHIAVGLFHRMGDQPVANNASVDKKIL